MGSFIVKTKKVLAVLTKKKVEIQIKTTLRHILREPDV